MSARILIIDDHVALRRGVEAILSDSLPEAEFGHAENAAQGLEQIRNCRWDLALLDLNLPGRGGLDLIRSLRDEQPKMGVLIYSVYSEEQFGLRAIRAGADGYLTKDRSAEEIVEAVMTILKGGQYISSELAATLVNNVKGDARDDHHLLSDREIQVLRMLASGKTPSAIGQELALSGKTISTYRSRVLDKLKLRTNADLVRYAIENGIID